MFTCTQDDTHPYGVLRALRITVYHRLCLPQLKQLFAQSDVNKEDSTKAQLTAERPECCQFASMLQCTSIIINKDSWWHVVALTSV